MSRDKAKHYYLLTVKFLMSGMSSISLIECRMESTQRGPPWLLSTLHPCIKMKS
jgi:hypothetical protein